MKKTLCIFILVAIIFSGCSVQRPAVEERAIYSEAEIAEIKLKLISAVSGYSIESVGVYEINESLDIFLKIPTKEKQAFFGGTVISVCDKIKYQLDQCKTDYGLSISQNEIKGETEELAYVFYTRDCETGQLINYKPSEPISNAISNWDDIKAVFPAAKLNEDDLEKQPEKERKEQRPPGSAVESILYEEIVDVLEENPEKTLDEILLDFSYEYGWSIGELKEVVISFARAYDRQDILGMIFPGVATASNAPKESNLPEAEHDNMVYWVDSGEVYHSTSDCPSLKRSKNIRNGTIKEAESFGKYRPCNVCS